MDHHTLAAVSITRTFLDVLGSLYLAYDLLGGQHGPLRLLTRAVTYSIVSESATGFGLGLFFGLASGVATGITTRLNSIEQLGVRTIIPCLGRHCSAPSAGLRSALDCSGSWASDSQSHLAFSSRPAKYSAIFAACVRPSIT